MLARKSRKNHCYFLCLLDWRDLLLSKATIDAFARAIGLPVDPPEPPTGWHVGPCQDITHDAVRNTTIGMAHSRIVFDFEFKDDSALNNFWQIRSIRKELEDQVIAFLEEKAITAMQPILEEWVRDKPERGGPRIFVYPVLEISSGKGFWKDLSEEKPFNIPTTCFHAHLRDFGGLRGRLSILGKIWGTTVKMRVSGAKIIASEMSNTFFWELVNVVYYQGLYPQSREPITSFPANQVRRSLENRLEKFEREFATTFYQFGSTRMLEGLNQGLVFLTAILIILAFITVFD